MFLSNCETQIASGETRTTFMGICYLHCAVGQHSKASPMQWHHRVDSVIESSLPYIIGSKNCAFNNLSVNFTEIIMNASKVIPENLVASANFEKFTSINHYRDQSCARK